MKTVTILSETIGVGKACSDLGIPRSSYYFWFNKNKPKEQQQQILRKDHPAKLSSEEEKEVLDLLFSSSNIDKTPKEIYTDLLDQGIYICSERTMYRILQKHGCSKDRRNLRIHPKYEIPRLCANGPNQVWTWDITQAQGEGKREYFYLYVFIDLYSRYVVGWLAAEQQLADLGQELLQNCLTRENISEDQIILHSDRGSQMTSKSWALLESDLGIKLSYSRPRTSNDNPFVESHFKTLKYRPEYPGKFYNLYDFRAYCQNFFEWYNHHHYHVGISSLTPVSVHHGKADEILEQRHQTKLEAYHKRPNRFNHPPKREYLEKEVWINKNDGMVVDQDA